MMANPAHGQYVYTCGYVTLPFIFDGGRNEISQEGLEVTANDFGPDYPTSPKLNFNRLGIYINLLMDEAPDSLYFDLKGYNDNGSRLIVEISPDHSDFYRIRDYTTIGNDFIHEAIKLSPNMRHVRWLQLDASNGSFALGNIRITQLWPKATVDLTENISATYHSGTIPVSYENTEVVTTSDIVFYESDGETPATYNWLNLGINGYSNISYSVNANYGNKARTAYFKIRFHAAKDKECYSDLISLTQDNYRVYNLATSVVSGKHYIITSGTDGNVQAMGKQNPNNRTVADISVFYNTTYILDTNVYEFVISGPDENNLYSIYDKNENSTGFLYAAGASSNNYLRTQSSNNNKGLWTISIDENTNAASIVSNITGRNTMRYYNVGSNQLFSCYASGQRDIYLFVKNDDKELEIFSETNLDNLDISDDMTFTVHSGNILTVNDTLTNTNPANLIIEDGSQLMTTSSGVMATIKKSIIGGEKDVSGWYTISSPIDNITSANITNLISSSDDGFSYDLYRYNESTMYWENQKNEAHDFTNLENGRGYLYYNTGSELSFAGEVNSDDVIYSTTNTESSGVLAGFNLIGNPYPHDIYKGRDAAIDDERLAEGYYKLSNASGWTTQLGYEDAIRSGEGILVQATEAFDLTITNTNTAATAAKASHGYIKIMLSNSQYEDVAYALFDKGKGLNKISHNNAEIPMIYILQNNAKYAIATMDENTKLFDLNFRATKIGMYTLKIKNNSNYEYLHVIDKKTGADIDMLLEGEYTFIGAPNDNDERFLVRLSENDICDTDDNDIFAYQTDNELIINGEGTLQMFDLLGHLVISREVSGVEKISTSSLLKGVYIIKIVGKTTKVQKITVK